ncbi:MAG: DUF362 domain-containing protein, partial [Bacteroidales bacterium]|nr:DUF362 domain-containing protein [Bacteroidales bacterium]
MNNQVSIVKCDTYSFEQIETAMEKLMFELGGMENFVKPGQRVMLKPNGAAPSSPDKHVTTHPLVIKAVIQQVKKAGGIPVIAESSAGIYPKITEQALKKCGFNQLAEDEGIEIINIDEYDKYIVNKPGEKINGFYITSLVKEVDVIINIPKLKAHEAMFLSCAVKNFYGVIPLGQKPEGHKRYSFRNNFADLLLDIYDEVKPHLTI